MSLSSDLGTAVLPVGTQEPPLNIDHADGSRRKSGSRSDRARDFLGADGVCDDERHHRRDHAALVVPAGTLSGLILHQGAGARDGQRSPKSDYLRIANRSASQRTLSAGNGKRVGTVMKEVLSVAMFALNVLCFVAFVTTVRPTAISAIQAAPDHCRRSWGCALYVFAAVSGAVRQPWQLGAPEFDASLTNAR
jgi:hypothetical protein